MTDVSIDEILDEIVAPRRTVTVCTRGDISERLEQLQDELAQARAADPDSLSNPAAAQKAAEIEALALEAVQHERAFVLEAIGNRPWADLIAQHPPTKAQRADGLDHDPSTFPVAAVAASSVSPKMTAEQAGRLADRLSVGQWLKLWTACLEVNIGPGDLPKFVTAIATARAIEPSSTTAAPEGSPDPSSSAGS